MVMQVRPPKLYFVIIIIVIPLENNMCGYISNYVHIKFDNIFGFQTYKESNKI